MTAVRSLGRARELAELRRAIDAAVAGRGRLVLVAGEPGIGKTQLVEDGAIHATERGAQVVVSRCPTAAGAPPYWPWTQALRACAGPGPVPVLDLLAPAADGSVGDGDEDDGGGRRQPAAGGADDDAARFELFTGVVEALRDAACRAPLVVVVEDLHRADAPSLRLLEHLAGTLPGMPLLVVGTYRDDEAPAAATLASAVARLPGDTVRLELRPLAGSPLAGLVARVAGSELSPELVEQLRRHTGGNPLYVQEVVRLLAAEGRLDGDPGRLAVPAGVRGVIDSRLAAFPPGDLDVLRWAAVCGDEFDPKLVTRCGDTPPDTVDRALDAARRRGLARPTADRPGRWALAHGLVADVLRDGLAPGDRRRRHLRVGRLLMEPATAEAGDRSVAAIAGHLLAALPDGDPAIAVGHVVRAARHASRALAWEEAARLYEQASAVLRTAGGAAGTGAARAGPTGAEATGTTGPALSGPAGLATVLVERAAVVARTGDGEASRRAALEALSAARDCGDGALLARAALSFSSRTFADGGHPATIGVLEDALGQLPGEAVPLRAQLVARLAEELAHVDRARSSRLADDAVALATRADDPVAAWEALVQQHRVRWGGTDLDERLAASAELVALGESLEDPERALLGRARRVVDLLAAGRRPDAEDEIAAFGRTVDAARRPSFRWHLVLWAGTRALVEGRLTAAEGHGADVAALVASRGEFAVGQHVAQLAGIRLHQDRLGEVEDAIAAAVERYPTLPVYRCALGFAHAEQGRSAAARATLEPLAADGFASVPRDLEWTTAAFCLAETSVLVDRPDWGRALLPRLLPYAAHQVVNGSGALYLGPVSRLLGRLAAHQGVRDAAARHYAAAVADAARSGSPLWAAQAKVDWAQLLAGGRRPGDGARAERLLGEAGAFADEMGVPRLRRQVDDVRDGRSGAAAPTPGAPDGGRTPADVFRRDGEQWTLVYRGARAHVRDRKGLHDIAALLAAPGHELHVFELLAAGGEARLDRGADPAVDGTALDSYRRRLADLQEELDEADHLADAGRAARARDELEVLTAHVADALGLGNRTRAPGDPVERARKAVRRRIRTSLDSIDAHLPALGHHLDRSIRTGTFCSYTPEHPVDWVLG